MATIHALRDLKTERAFAELKRNEEQLRAIRAQITATKPLEKQVDALEKAVANRQNKVDSAKKALQDKQLMLGDIIVAVEVAEYNLVQAEAELRDREFKLSEVRRKIHA